MNSRALFCALALVLPSISTYAAGSGRPQGIASVIDEYMTIRTRMGGFSGAVLVAKGDNVIFRKGYGYADVEQRLPYRPDTQHEIASLSKMFTAMAALKLRDGGRLGLDDSIYQYLDDCPATCNSVTVRQLMRHTSGIPDYEEPLELGSPK